MTPPRIEHADVSEYIQMAISAAEDLSWPCPDMLDLAEVYRLSTDDPATED